MMAANKVRVHMRRHKDHTIGAALPKDLQHPGMIVGHSNSRVAHSMPTKLLAQTGTKAHRFVVPENNVGHFHF
jgi:hypothetical protein